MPSPTSNTQTYQPDRPDQPQQQIPRRRRAGPTAAFLLLVVLIVAAIVVWLNRQAIGDWWRLRGYNPPAAVAKLADQDTMKPYTRHLFYLNKPQLPTTVAAFRKDCPENKDTIVLGCYHTGQNGIFIYDVQDPTLAGVQQVTAAHEVLHAVYARLSDSERRSLDAQLEDFYKHDLKDPRVIAEVKLYQKTEPGEVMDEMSCTFGTELSKLSSGLEAYYKQYFGNRAAIVAYEKQYEGEFSRRESLIKQYDSQLSGLKSRIKSAEADLDSKLTRINAEQSRLESQQSSDIAAYNAGVPAYNQLVDAYNAEIASTRDLIDSYNRLVGTRNGVAGQLAELDKAIDTRLTPAATR